MSNPSISFEFFPPKTVEGRNKLDEVRDRLARFNPEFYSVTYGASGSTRDTTSKVVIDYQAEGYNIAPHLSFGGDSEGQILDLLQSYKAAGVSNLVALRGDLPLGMGDSRQLVHANQLVAFVREHFGSHFNIHVAAYPEIHPEAECYSKDIYWLGEKFRAGANTALTQYFYNADAYFEFVDNCTAAGIEQPIVPGIMPITNYSNLVRFSDSCGADIPRWLRWQLKEHSCNPEELIKYGEQVVTRLCEQLLAGGAPGLHFYTMNQSRHTEQLCRNLGIGQ